MKKKLLASSALIAVAVISGPALAAEPMAVTVSGSAHAFFFLIDTDAPNRQASKVAWQSEIHFKAKTTLDNGVQIGARVELEGETKTDQIDEHYIWVQGEFGKFVVGADDSAAKTMHYLPPDVGDDGVDDGDYAQIGTSANAAAAITKTYTALSGDAPKLTYYTPRMGGFQLGASWTPDASTKTIRGGTIATFGVPVKNDGLERLFAVGVNFKQPFNGVGIGLSGGYETGKQGASDPYQYSFGSNITFDDFTLGAAVTFLENVGGVTTKQRHAWSAGGIYETGPWVFGTGYFESENETATTSDKFRRAKLATNYDLGGGAEIGVHLDWFQNINAAAANEEAVSAGVIISTYF